MNDEIILESNLEIKKCIHQLKFYDIPSYEIIKDVKNIITSTSKGHLCLESLSIITNLDLSNNDKVIESLNNLITFREEYISTNTKNNNDDFINMVNETYSTVEKIIYDMYNEIYDIETDYIETLIESIDVILEAPGTAAVKAVGSTTFKAGKAVAKGANTVWQALLNLIKNIREAFMSKHKKITERDAAWLKENTKLLTTMNMTNLEINIHSDYKRSFSDAHATYKNFSQIVDSNFQSFNKYEDFTAKIKQFTDSNGDLKTGLSNRYRTGNVNSEYSINNMKGNAINNAVRYLIQYCNDFIANFNTISKDIKDSENFIKKVQTQSKLRGVNEGYCYIEESLYCDTELGLIFDFDYVLEQEDNSANNTQQTNNTTTNTNVNTTEVKKEEDKVGVTKRNEVKETTDKMSNDKLSIYNKICRDKHMALTTFMTTSEKKYFESITILRGLVKNKE